MLLLGIDIGTSFIKVAVVDANNQQVVASTQYPETESEIISLHPGWAEQSPDTWWEHVQLAIVKLHRLHLYNPKDIAAIGIAYQMHGLVMVDSDQNVLRNSIIWCDSRAVDLGNNAFDTIGHQQCLSHVLNSPGNFTASKLAWVKQHEPTIFAKATTVMLPGDFIAMKLTGEITTSVSAMSEGVLWDFKNNELSKDVCNHYGFDTSLFPVIKNVFEEHGRVTNSVAEKLSLNAGIPVTYKAGDQPNNALSLNVLQPGEVAATAGTSGVIYSVSDQLTYDNNSRVNSFAHVNYTDLQKRIGVLLCINGTGVLNRWVKNIAGNNYTYQQMNEAASTIKPGCDGLLLYPFGNGAERIFNNKILGASVQQLDLNKHSNAHVFRAAQEGIAFAFKYGLDIMRENGIAPTIIRAGKANMFLSELFVEAFVNTLQVPVQMYNADGSVGAAIGAGLGAGIYATEQEAFINLKPLQIIEPNHQQPYDALYETWLNQLLQQLK